jgi:outer membrane protein assembly factor BamC
MDYTRAETTSRIKVPDILDQQAIHNDLYSLPVLSPNPEVSQNDFEPPRPDFIFAEVGNADAHITGSSAAQLISVRGTVPQVWEQLEIFWHAQGLTVASDDVATGVMLTDWYDPNAQTNQSDGFITRWIWGLMGSDVSIPHYRFRIILTEQKEDRVYIELRYAHQTAAEIAAGKTVDWSQPHTSLSYESEVMYELLRHLSRSMKVAYRSQMDYQMNRQFLSLLGRDQQGWPLIKIELPIQEAMIQVIDAMGEFDVGSYDIAVGKVYFMYTTHLRAAENTAGSERVLDWFKDLHTGERNSIKLDTDLLGDQEKKTVTLPVRYSNQGPLASDLSGLEDKKGFRIWLADEVIYVFEDEDQGDLDAETGQYSYSGRFQLFFAKTLKGVYLQVLNDKGELASINHAEEILWHIQQALDQQRTGVVYLPASPVIVQ